MYTDGVGICSRAAGTKAYNVTAGNFQYAIKEVLLADDWFTNIYDLK